MNSKNSKKSSELERAVALLMSGQVLAIATETVYGLMCDPRNQAAVDTIFELKGRDFAKPLQVLVADAEQAAKTIEIPDHAQELTKKWPGPLTMVAKAHINLAKRVGTSTESGSTIGVRVPDAVTIRALLKLFGPLAATSANPSGQLPATTKVQVEKYFGSAIRMILGDDGEIKSGVASRVVDVTRYPHQILRAGQAVVPLQHGEAQHGKGQTAQRE